MTKNSDPEKTARLQMVTFSQAESDSLRISAELTFTATFPWAPGPLLLFCGYFVLHHTQRTGQGNPGTLKVASAGTGRYLSRKPAPPILAPCEDPLQST